MFKSKVIFVIVALFFICNFASAASFGFKTESVEDVTCSSGTIFQAKKLSGKSYNYPFWTSKTGISSGKTVIGVYKKIDNTKCYKNNDDKTPVTVYIVDKIGVSR